MSNQEIKGEINDMLFGNREQNLIESNKCDQLIIKKQNVNILQVKTISTYSGLRIFFRLFFIKNKKNNVDCVYTPNTK
jgi:hypothetical protein